MIGPLRPGGAKFFFTLEELDSKLFHIQAGGLRLWEYFILLFFDMMFHVLLHHFDLGIKYLTLGFNTLDLSDECFQGGMLDPGFRN